ncbi:unnamed protein product [Penicillium egyptiacum]|uniref:Uncharacterized protein n=1 Tax=Penicillium egyptiacum TaxID=1303716 RepID=A0A9W4KHJ7_9EURO|nr:unnamed protein product [Penicillium egyptiacum]
MEGEEIREPVRGSQSIQTLYAQMIIDFYCTPWRYNVLASTANWVLLAGYLVIPGTFTSLQKSKSLEHKLDANDTGKTILDTIQNPPILGIACSFLILGAVGMGALGWDRRHNYVWLIDRMFIPTFFNSVAGLITTIINIYTARNGDWPIMAVLTASITAVMALTSFVLIMVYQFGKLERIKEEHVREIDAAFRMLRFIIMENTTFFNADLQDSPESFFLGFAKVQIRSFEFGINDEQNVLNYLRFFECHGCSRSDPEHHVSAVANQDIFTNAIESQNLSAIDFYDVKNPPFLRLGLGNKLRCIRGHDLLEAGHRYLPPGERWWYTKLYRDGQSWLEPFKKKKSSLIVTLDIPKHLEDHIRQNYSISEPASDEVIFRSILLRDDSLEKSESKFGSSADYHYVKQVNRNRALRSALKKLARYRGLWGTFTYRKLEYIVSPRCDEEIVHYLSQIYEIWSLLFPGENASLVDVPSVELVEGRIPKYSLDDRTAIEDGMRSGLLFPRLEANRDGVLKGLLAVSGRILTLTLLFRDAICLGPPAKAMREILPIPKGETIKKVFLRNWRDWDGKFVIQLSETKFEDISLGPQSDDAESMVALTTLSQLWLVALRYHLSPRVGRANKPYSVQPLLEIQGKGVLEQTAKALGLNSGQSPIRDPNLPAFQHVTAVLSGAPDGIPDASLSAWLSKRFTPLVRMRMRRGEEGTRSPPNIASDRESQRSSYRSGRPLQREYQHDRQFLFFRYIFYPQENPELYPTSFAIMRDFFLSFFGQPQLLGQSREVLRGPDLSITEETSTLVPSRPPSAQPSVGSRYPSPGPPSAQPSVGSRYPSPEQESTVSHDQLSLMQPLQSPGEFRLTSMVSLPPHPEIDSHERQQNLFAPGFEDHDSMAPTGEKNKILRLADAKDILSDWFQAIPNNGAVVVFFFFQTHEYIKFYKQDEDAIKRWLDDLVTRRRCYFLTLDGDRLMTVEIEHATSVAVDISLLFVGDNSAFFVGDKSKNLTRGISQTQLDEYIANYDVLTGRPRKRARDDEEDL